VSIEKVKRAGGEVWRVRWRDERGGAHSRVVGRKRDAQALDAELRRAKRLGALSPVDTERETVSEFAKAWWARYVVPNLARHTQLNYASMLDVHIIPRLGNVRLRALTPDVVGQLRAEMAADGVGEAATRKTLVVLRSMFERAVEWRRIESNPAKAVRKPSQVCARVVRPLAPHAVETMRAHLLADERLLDATLIAVLAYAGLRPGEALGLRWNDVGERTLLVERSVAFGKLKSTKTGKVRTARLLGPLAESLATWRRATNRAEPRT
jgi:integrase